MRETGDGPLELAGLGAPEWWEPLLELRKQGMTDDAAVAELGLTQHAVRWWRNYSTDAEAEYTAAAQAGRWADVTAVLHKVERLVQEGTPLRTAFAANQIPKTRMAVYLRNNPDVHERLKALKVGKGIADHRLLVGYLRIALVEETKQAEDAFALIYLRALKSITESVDVTGAEITVAELRDRVLSAVAVCMAHRDDMPSVLREELGLEEDDDEE